MLSPCTFWIGIWVFLFFKRLNGVIPSTVVELERLTFEDRDPGEINLEDIPAWDPSKETNQDGEINDLINSHKEDMETYTNFETIALKELSFLESHSDGRVEQYNVNASVAEFLLNKDDGNNNQEKHNETKNGDDDDKKRRFLQLGPDTRTIAGNYYPYYHYGRLVFYHSGSWRYCTGALVGPRHVLTNAVCMYWNGAWSTNVYWYPNYPYQTSYYYYSTIRITTGWYYNYNYNYNYALVSFQSYYSSNWLRYGYNNYLTTSTLMTSCGYATYYSRYRTAFYPSLYYTNYFQDYTSDVTGGQIGSPVFYYYYPVNDYVVIGVYSFSYTNRNVWDRITYSKFWNLCDWILQDYGTNYC